MKKVLFTLMCLAVMFAAGTSLKAQEITITLEPGWNWISYPNAEVMDVASALGDFVPMSGDIVRSRFSSSSYLNGRWKGGVTHFMPGWGYMYYSSRTEDVELVFAQPSSNVVATATPTDVTAVSAVVGGMIMLPEGSHVFQHGVCWGTEPNPGIDGNHTAEGEGAIVGSFSSTLEGLTPSTTYYVRAYVVSDYGLAYGSQLSFTTHDGSGGDHAYVDLGLPSGLLWATCNVGADNPEDYGDYFAWGETQPKDYYSWSTYQYCNGSFSTLTKYCSNSSYGYNGFTDNLTILLPEDDAATANWGTGWRMPTYEEWEELLDNTTVTWTTQNGVNGRLFTASNGNSLFLPAASLRIDDFFDLTGSYGYYWSSSVETYFYSPHAYNFVFNNSGTYSMDSGNRYCGTSVRPVRSSGQNNAPIGAINGKFTINENGDQVYFSQGNLQYQASTNTWKFAENQYDYIGEANSNISSTYSGWIDLFGWGTSGWNCGNTYYHPWDTDCSNGGLYGPSVPNYYDPFYVDYICLKGGYANADWGVYNPISNAGNTANQWRTMTIDEWYYLIRDRVTASGIRFAKAQVNCINGVILLPDEWSSNIYDLNNTNTIDVGYSSNTLTASQWNILENAGAVFLPTAGCRHGMSYYNNNYFYYWSASAYPINCFPDDCCAEGIYLSDVHITLLRYEGLSVRLVHDAPVVSEYKDL